MAGKIALGVLMLISAGLFGYAVRDTQHKNRMLPFRVAQVVQAGAEQETIHGMKPPYTVLVHESSYVQQTLPGQLGNLGDEMYLPDPRYSSESTIEP